MTIVDLEPATKRVGDITGIPDDLLGAPTPCPAYTVADLLEHVGGLARAFTAAAAKEPSPDAGQAEGDASQLGDGWRTRIPRDLAELAQAWRDPSAWTGTTSAGGVDMPGEVAGLVALDEVIVHGWDLARATGQPYDGDDALLHAIDGLLAQFGERTESGPTVAFGPVVAVPDDAPLLDRIVGLTGRDPAWSARS